MDKGFVDVHPRRLTVLCCRLQLAVTLLGIWERCEGMFSGGGPVG